MQYALLVHGLDWGLTETEYTIQDGIMFINLSKHKIGDLYTKLCLTDGVDEGSPFNYVVGIVVDDKNSNDYGYFPSASHGSYSTLLVNLLTLLFKNRISAARVISSKDDFCTSWGTYELYNYQTDPMMDLSEGWPKINTATLENYTTIWMNLKNLNLMRTSDIRVSNALDFYYFAWNTLTLHQTAICLSVVLETLFAPNSNSELTHQIAFNIAKFFESTEERRLERYKFIKKYYGIRSKLVHGETISDSEEREIPVLFRFVSEILFKIVIDKDLIVTFNDNKKRKEFFNHQMFS